MEQRQTENSILTGREEPVSSIKESANAKTCTILLVDDEPEILGIYEEGLELEGFNVETFADPEEALSHFKPGAYDAIILDIRMPKMTGFELCRAIRNVDEKVKICFMTAFEVHLKEIETVLPRLKIDELITKPIRISDLNSKIQRLLTPVEPGDR